MKNGFTPKASYDTALRNLRAAEARLAAARANLDLTRDQLNYTELKAEFDGVITAVGAEAGQNVTPGQLVVRLARPGDKDAVFSIAETAIGDRAEHGAVLTWPLSNPNLLVEGMVREISPVADPTTRTYTVKVTLKDPPPQVRFGMSIGGRWKASPLPVVALPLSALFEKNGAPAVWVFDQASGSVVLKPVTVARYEADTVIIADGRCDVATSSLPPASTCCARTRRCVSRRRPRWRATDERPSTSPAGPSSTRASSST